MKIQNYINCGIVFLMLFTLTNCEDLEYDETIGNSKEDVFSDFARSKSFLTGIYAYLPTDFNSVGGSMRSAATDEAEYTSDLSDIQKFNDGIWSSIQPLDNVWSTMYTGIRATNVFLKESEGQEFLQEQYNDNYKDIIAQYKNYPYEARFLRAFFYFELVKRYKNIPLVTTVLTPEEAVNVQQSSFEEVINFIVSECDATAAVLPRSYANFTAAKETGRATKGAAMALKARALLYAASPLHNSDPVDVTLWEKAAKAAKDIIDLNAYSLITPYSTVVNNNASVETIFDRRVAPSNDFEKRNTAIGFEGGASGTCPTQNLIDAYEMSTNGLGINEIGSGYRSTSPYAQRDTRLAQTVITNGTAWKTIAVQTFIGGTNGLPITNATKTGYYLRKYLIEAINLDPKLGAVTTREHTWVIFRYAEVLLNYAEAMNEAYATPQTPPAGGGMTALEAVNIVRRRANGTRFVFPIGMTKEAFRTKLRNERRVELAFEDHRFWDVRRWKIGDQTKDIYAMKITRNPNLTLNFEKTLLETRKYEEKMNLYPIPQSEIFKNNNLQQNTGW